MKNLAITIGGILSIAGLFRLSDYIFNYNQLTQYGKGYIWGNILILIFGISLIYWAFKYYNKTD